MCEISVQKIKDLAPDSTLLYNGGGNFYIFVWNLTEADLSSIRQSLVKALLEDDLYLSLSWVPVQKDDLLKFDQKWKELQVQSNIDKLKKYQGFDQAFVPLSRNVEKSRERERIFTKELALAQGFSIQGGKAAKSHKIDGKKIYFSDHIFQLRPQPDPHSFAGKISNKLPLCWDEGYRESIRPIIEKVGEERRSKGQLVDIPNVGEIMDFEHLAALAQDRTGTDKLGVLKLDVDFLGDLFSNTSDYRQTARLSQALHWFFEEFIHVLWEATFVHHTPEILDDPADSSLENKEKKLLEEKITFRNNIYVVYSGGDDCFLLGAWDAVFEFAGLIQRAFRAFAEYLNQAIPHLKSTLERLGREYITISAGLILIDEKFPVIRFAKIAEDALGEAKGFEKKINESTIGQKNA
ncbi:MAG: hypothetical protein AAFU64_14085, partial [Bacteroidota bacterium]